MTRTTVFGIAVWLLVGTICVFGFWVGDTATSREAIHDRFDEERATVSETGNSQTGRVGSGVASVGLHASERVALYAYDTERSLVGGIVELAVLVGVFLPPAAVSWRGARRVGRWAQ